MPNKENNNNETRQTMEVSFVLPKNKSNAIKVVGVGGGGSNAVEYMYKQQIEGVDFVVCNTDAQALNESPVPVKIQLGVELTQGMGAGSNPDVGYQAALESEEQIRNVLSVNTKMVFITAGMGGGTGTGAAPVIARISKELDLLTVAIVTTPFDFEGERRMKEARKGIKKLREYVDAIIVINNNKLVEVYGDLGYKAGFAKADEVLSAAAKGMAEVITHHYKRNIDLNDAKTVLANSGNAIMGSASAQGQDRAKRVIADALSSPLLNDNKIKGATQVLLLIISGQKEVTFNEISEINKYIRKQAGTNVNIILGIGDDPSLGDSIAVTVIATGFPGGYQNKIIAVPPKKVVHALNEEQSVQVDLFSVMEDDDSDDFDMDTDKKIVYTLDDSEEKAVKSEEKSNELFTPVEAMEIEVDFEEQFPESEYSDIELESMHPDTLLKEDAEQTMSNTDMKEKTEVKQETDSPAINLFDIKKEKHRTSDRTELPEVTEGLSKAENRDLEIFKTTNEKIEYERKEVIQTKEDESSDHKRVDQMSIKFPEEITEDLHENDNKIVHHLEQSTDVSDTVQQKHESEKVEEEMKIVIKKMSENEQVESMSELRPVSRTIQELRKNKYRRKEQWKEKFNHSFGSYSGNIKEMEKEPAYKRMNIDIESGAIENNVSSTSMETDENGEIHLNSENSFLHDNVD